MAAAIVILFILGYLAIVLENTIRLNKAASALVTGVLCWTVYILSADNKDLVAGQLIFHLGEMSQILFFLMGAMAIVELIDSHDGFEIVKSRIRTTSKRKLIWIIGLLAFFFSAVLDNLTTAIVMVSLVRKLADDKQDRWMLAGLIIIAANAGGAWSPIGDVTTTMLWIGNQLTAGNVVLQLIIPSIICLVVPILIMSSFFKGNVKSPPPVVNAEPDPTKVRQRNIVFFSGIILLLLVPVFKIVTHLPPFMAILMGVGVMWIITEIIHSGKDEEDRKIYSVAYALQKIDSPSILFFLGILLAISALESVGQLQHASAWMDANLKNQNVIVMTIGLLSSVIDNVPLVAGSQGMYGLAQYPTDHYFWEFLAYCSGTGGSILIIGSAAGVAAMGIEKIDFTWYLKRISWLALLGYLAGAAVYILQHYLIGG